MSIDISAEIGIGLTPRNLAGDLRRLQAILEAGNG